MSWTHWSPTVLLVLTLPSPAQEIPTYKMRVPVDEVVVTFHATDARGLPVEDLQPNDLTVFDNDQKPPKILSLQHAADRAISAAFLLDRSASMRGHGRLDRAIAARFVQEFLRPQTDEIFASMFDSVTQPVQEWTRNFAAIGQSLDRASAADRPPARGTALFDTVFSTCAYKFGKSNDGARGRAILLFSDGEDNASHVVLKDVVDICQRAGVAIYVFRADTGGEASSGPGSMGRLAAETGGRVFHDDDSDAALVADLREIAEAERSEYRLVYRAKEFKHDGSFHSIVVLGPDRVAHIAVRSGYYAPTD